MPNRPLDKMTMQERDPFTRLVTGIVGLAICRIPSLESSRRSVEMLARYAGVGVASSLLYALAVGAWVSGFHVQHDLATILAYALVAPVNFGLHRGFTFHSCGMMRADLVRYLSLQALSLFVSLAVMAFCVDACGFPYQVGVIAALVLVPIVTFLVMDRWVFALKAI